MTFVKYQNSNNASSKLITDISASATTLLITDWDQDLFPTQFPYLLTIEHLNTEEKVITREIVRVTSSAQNSLVVERWAWICVQDDTATNRVQWNTAHSFSSWDSISLYWTSEQVRDIQNKLETSANDSSIANEYSSSQTYSVWDVVMYKWNRYVCNTDISTAEDFDLTKWTNTSLQNYLNNIQTQIDDIVANWWASDHIEDEYLVWCYYTLEDPMFRQVTATYDNSNIEINVWDSSRSYEIHIQRLWSWTASNQLKLKLKALGTPTSDLVVEVRKWISVIDTEAQSSYWYGDSTDVIASAVISHSNITSSRQEITVNFTDSFWWVEWELLDVVVYQQNHNINSQNCYVIWCDETQRSEALQFVRMLNDWETFVEWWRIPYCDSDWFASIVIQRVRKDWAWGMPRNLKSIWEKAKVTTYWRHIDWTWIEHTSEDSIEYVTRWWITYTIKRDEVSDPAQAFVWYEDDATGFTQWDDKFNDFFWYSWVKLNRAWEEVAQINLSSMSTQDLTWTENNIMVKFPIRWVKLSKDGNNRVTLSITENPYGEDLWYQYYAFSRWKISNPIKKDKFYLWVYQSYSMLDNSVNYLVSKSWYSTTESKTINQWITEARKNDWNTWTGDSWYDIQWIYQRRYVTCLYIMKYWNPDSQSVIWKWMIRTSSTSALNTWTTNSISWDTYWTTANTTTWMKLFWLENFWWNSTELIWWLSTHYFSDDTLSWTYLAATLSWGSNYNSWGSVWEYEMIWPMRRNANNLVSINWDNKWMFGPYTLSSWNYNTYYCDYSYVSNTSDPVAHNCNALSDAAHWIFCVDVSWSSSYTWSTRLMYL